MKKKAGLFHKNKRNRNELEWNELEWIDFDDEEEDYGDDETDDYEEEDGEEYYEEDEVEDDEEYYEEDEDEEEYYEDDEEDDEEYYEEDEDEEEYYEDNEIEDDEEYYEEDEEEYYEDDEIDDEEDYDEEYYEEDEDDEDEDYEDEEEDERRGIGAVIYKLTHLPAADYAVALTGVAVLVLAVITGTLYLNARNIKKQVETFADIGVGLEDIDIIGEQGLVAIADAKAAKLMAASMEETEEETPGNEEEADDGKEAQVIMNLTSVQKDLKIKFVNSKTGKLISNIAFEVEIEKPSGETYSKKDEDKDGIIYQTDLTPGKYKVKITAPASDEEYLISSEKIAITVRDTIEYKKIDVADEVKTEAQVNAAVEDTKVNETVVESVNADTVEWVESTKTLIEGTEKKEESYEKVDSSKVADPAKAAIGFRLLMQEDGNGENQEGNPTPEPMEEPTTKPEEPTTNPEEPTTKPEEPTTKPEEPTTKPEGPTGDPTAEPTAIPSATPTATAGATALPSTSATPTATPKVTPTATPKTTPTATPTATPNKAASDDKTPLKSTDGEVLYVKLSDGSFREAKYKDYYDKNIKEFYRKTSKTTGEYRYTGWQHIDGVTYFFDKNGNKVTGDQVIQGAKYSFNSDGSLNKSSGNMGIDVSKWNGSIDWNAVRNSGVSYVIIRCGYRGSTTGALIEDPTFRTNIQGATKAGLKVGVYFFTQATNEIEAVEEASMVVGLIKGYNISYPVFLDVEPSGGRADGISTATRTAVCKAFCQTVQNSGYKAGIYANKTWFNEKIDAPSLTGYKIWLAQYAAAPSYTRTRYDMWQYSSKGSVSGISGNVDMNISYMGY